MILLNLGTPRRKLTARRELDVPHLIQRIERRVN
jgi:hypothetical protein